MFAAIARFDIRFRWIIVVIWIVGVIVTAHLLPNLSSVTQSNTTQFLSTSSPSVQASQLATPFQTTSPSRTAIIVASRKSGPLTAADTAAIGEVAQAVKQVPGVSEISPLRASPDGRAAEVVVLVTASASSSTAASTTVVDAIRARFTQVTVPAGLSFHLTGPLAATVDAANTNNAGNITRFTLLFVIVLLFLVYRAVLAPLLTLIPAALAVVLSGPLIAEIAKAGISVASISQQLLVVLLLGAGTDYGLFLSFRVREELAQGRDVREAVVRAMTRVGEAISYSALTVAAALLTLLLASFGIYRGLGPALAIGIGVLLAASLTLTPALLSIFGPAAFWPTRPRPGAQQLGLWGGVAERVVRHPRATLAAGIVLFGALSLGLIGFQTSGLTGAAPVSSDSAVGAAVLAAHFPQATVGSDQLLLLFSSSVWDNPELLSQAQRQLASSSVFQSVTGPLGFGPGSVSADQLAQLHDSLGPAASLPPSPPSGSHVSPALYAVYRATAQFISPDGRTIQYDTALRAGPSGSTAAANAIPAARAVLGATAHATGAQMWGIAGTDASAYDINAASNTSLELVVPVVLLLILVLLSLLLRSLVAPWYLVVTVGLSYLASLGFAMLVFVHIGGTTGLIFVLPLLMFVFSMALGADYNILLMSRIREEARHTPTLSMALTRAIGITGGTITSAGIILAGTFAVLGLAGGSSESQQLGFSIAFGVLLDTFFVRTLLVPSIALLLGRWNWWPSTLSTSSAFAPPIALPAGLADIATEQVSNPLPTAFPTTPEGDKS